MEEKQEKQNPAYFAIIPADVRYDKKIYPNAKLLYGEITALTKLFGYCTAENEYFAELYGVSRQAVSKWVGQLRKQGYIRLEYDKKHRRRIYIKTSSKVSDIAESEEGCEPVVNTCKPVVNTCKPVVNTCKPVVNTCKPVVNTCKPVANTQMPISVGQDGTSDPPKKDAISTYKKTLINTSTSSLSNDDDDKDWFFNVLKSVKDAGFPNVEQGGLFAMLKEGYSKEEIEGAFRHVRDSVSWDNLTNPAGMVFETLRSGIDTSDAPPFPEQGRGVAIPESVLHRAGIEEPEFFESLQAAVMRQNAYVGKLLAGANIVSVNGFVKIGVPVASLVALQDFQNEVEMAVEFVSGENMSVEFVEAAA